MTHDEINSNRLLLVKIMAKKKPDGQYEAGVQKELQDLAIKVGASTQTTFLNVVHGGSRTTSDASIHELAFNIHFALQTASMINMCSTADRGYKIAEDSIKKSTITWWIAASIAFLSMLAAWIGALYNSG
jgi:lipoate-protein ligase B